jgi:hypothetical protein
MSKQYPECPPLRQHSPLPIQVAGIETANHNQKEAGIVMTQNRVRQNNHRPETLKNETFSHMEGNPSNM